MSDSPAVVLYDADGNALSVQDGVAVPANTPAVMQAAYGVDDDKSHYLETIYDETAAVNRLQIGGKVSVIPPMAPEGATEVVIGAYDPLDVKHRSTTTYTITNGKVLYIQQLSFGAEGDPTEKGSKVSVFYDNGPDRIIDIVYVSGFTSFLTYPDTSKTLDGVTLAGNGTYTIKIVRSHFGGSRKELFCVLRGYEK